jgi:hypothetical protein
VIACLAKRLLDGAEDSWHGDRDRMWRGWCLKLNQAQQGAFNQCTTRRAVPYAGVDRPPTPRDPRARRLGWISSPRSVAGGRGLRTVGFWLRLNRPIRTAFIHRTLAAVHQRCRSPSGPYAESGKAARDVRDAPVAVDLPTLAAIDTLYAIRQSPHIGATTLWHPDSCTALVVQ